MSPLRLIWCCGVLAAVGILLVPTASSAVTRFQPGEQADQSSEQAAIQTDKQTDKQLTGESAEKHNAGPNEPGDPTKAQQSDSSTETVDHEYKTFHNVYYYKSDEFTLLCDIYQPVAEGPFPAVLAIHGGAWRRGSKLQMLRHAWKLASAGYVVVSINYRHAPNYQFPAQVHDVKNAVRWMRYKQEKLKINPNQIAVFGYSAGGHLAAMLGTTDEKDNLDGDVPEILQPFSSSVQCVVAGGAPCEFSWIKSNALKDWLGDNQAGNPEVYKQAAPTTYVTANDPPFIFFHGTADKVVPIESARKLHERLLVSGVSSEFRSVEKQGHFSTFSDTSWLDDAIAFMDKKLKRNE